MFEHLNLQKLGIIGAIVMIVCCLAPVLVVLFGITGLGWLAGYLELAGAGVIFAVLGLVGYVAWRGQKHQSDLD